MRHLRWQDYDYATAGFGGRAIVDTVVLIFACAVAALVIPLHLQLILKTLQSAQYRSGNTAMEPGNRTILPLQLVTPYSMGFCSDGTWDLFLRVQENSPREV
jgi:hypothetical protein